MANAVSLAAMAARESLMDVAIKKISLLLQMYKISKYLIARLQPWLLPQPWLFSWEIAATAVAKKLAFLMPYCPLITDQ